MRVLIAGVTCLAAFASAAPQNPLRDLISGVGNLLGMNENAGEVDNYEGAPYTVTARYQGYEERVYPAANWVCTRASGSTDGMFGVLFQYISGNNNRNAKIDMTVPVMTSHQGNSKDMCFYIPPKFQRNPPTPTNRSARIVSMPRMTLLAKTLKAGFPNWEKEGRAFQREVAAQNGLDSSSFYSMAYDSPFKLFNRRNEVLIRKL